MLRLALVAALVLSGCYRPLDVASAGGPPPPPRRGQLVRVDGFSIPLEADRVVGASPAVDGAHISYTSSPCTVFSPCGDDPPGLKGLIGVTSAGTVAYDHHFP